MASSLRPNSIPAKTRPPMPPASAIADVGNRVANVRRKWHQLGVDYRFNKSQLHTQKQLYLSQLRDAHTANVQTANQDYMARGLFDSGIRNEGLVRLAADRDKQRNAYLLDVQQQVERMAQALGKGRADLVSQKQMLTDRLQRLKAERAASLRAAGYGV